MPKIRLIVDDENESVRIDQFVSLNSELTRTYVQKLIKEERIVVNESKIKNSYKVISDDVIDIDYDEATICEIVPKDIPIDIVYEDDDVIVVNKQKGLVVHPAPGNYDNTLVNGLLYKCKSLSSVNGYYRPGIVHRIDKDTSGLLVVAKNNNAHNFISEQLKDKTCFRKYYCLCKGVIEPNNFKVDAPIGRNPKDRQKMCVTDINGKQAISEFKVLERMDDSSLLDVNLLTGRTHQIRVHLAYIKHPVLNDNKYGGPIIDETGQYLHAYYLSFIHPRTNKRVEFSTKMPQYMINYLSNKGIKYE